MTQGKIIQIGQEAIDPSEHLLLFFGKTVTAGLKPYAVIQEIPDPTSIMIKKGDTITFGAQAYQVDYVGNTALKNLHSIQHLTFVFDPVPKEDVIVNGVYLTPHVLPKIETGMTISYPSASEDVYGSKK